MQKVVTRTTFKDAPKERRYWLSRPPEERIAAVEELRRQAAALRPGAEQGLQRVCRVTRLDRS